MTGNDIDWKTVEKEAVDLLSKYLQINTVNPPGGETEGAKFLQEILEKEGVSSDIYESQPNRGSLITRYAGDEKCADLILLHHIDVVPVEEKNWKHDPFSGELIDNEVWGRGAVDCKSLGIMELMAFMLLKREGLNPEKHIVYAATADEETGGKWGVPWLMANHPEKLDTKYVINEGVGFGLETDKSNLYLCQVAEKNSCWIRINFTGRPGHGSLPNDENCVVDMTKAVTAISNISFPVQVVSPVDDFVKGIASEQGYLPEAEFLGLLDEQKNSEVLKNINDKAMQQMMMAALKHTVIPTVIRSGTKTNVVPGECYCEVDCRLLPGTPIEVVIDEIKQALTKAGCRNFSIDFAQIPQVPASSVDTFLYRDIEESFKEIDSKAKVVPFMSPGATDSRFFREKGIPAYGIQVESSIGSAELVHGHNERVNVEQFVKGVKFLYDLTRKFCV